MFPRFTWKSEGRGEFNPDLRQWYEEVVYFPCNMASPFGGSGSKAAPRSSVHVQLSSPLSFLVRIRFSLISVSTLLLCFKISCYLAGLLFYPPLFLCFPPVRGQHGRRRNDQRPPFGRFVPGFFKFRLVRPVDWSVKTGRKKMAAILDQLARSMPTLPSVRL